MYITLTKLSWPDALFFDTSPTVCFGTLEYSTLLSLLKYVVLSCVCFSCSFYTVAAVAHINICDSLFSCTILCLIIYVSLYLYNDNHKENSTEMELLLCLHSYSNLQRIQLLNETNLEKHALK